MRFLFPMICVAGSLVMSPTVAMAQRDGNTQVETLLKEIELLKRELDLLKRENELLKKENAQLAARGNPVVPGKAEKEKGLRVTVGDVEYVYQGTTRSGTLVVVTVLATSKNGVQMGPNGQMTIIDPEGEKYLGLPQNGFGRQPLLREGVPVKLTWRMGGRGSFGAGPRAPSARVERYAAVIIQQTVANTNRNTVEFRNVPAVVAKPK